MPAATPDVTDLSASDILAIPRDRPDRLFEGTGFDGAHTADEQTRRRLAAKWHPDRHAGNAEALAVYQHLMDLTESARACLQAGEWPGLLTLGLRDGKVLRMRYQRARRFDLGTMYVADRRVVYVFDEAHRDLYRHGIRMLQGLRYPDPAVEQKYSVFFPKQFDTFESDRGPVLGIPKTSDVVLLRDLADHVGIPMDPRHVAWVMSRLHALATYLSGAGVVHHAIDLDHCFVSIPHHTVLLLGGWWFSRYTGDSLAGAVIPVRTANIRQEALTPAERNERTALCKVDHALIRATGRELLGDPGGTRLLHAPPPGLARPFAEWLLAPLSGDAKRDFEGWVRARDASFSEHRFTKLEVDPRAIYGPTRA